VKRFEGLVEGSARFAADLAIEGALHLVFVRSPHAHARITNVDTTRARTMDGVAAVFTAGDLAMIPVWEIHIIPETLGQPPLAVDTARYVGERVARHRQARGPGWRLRA